MKRAMLKMATVFLLCLCLVATAVSSDSVSPALRENFIFKEDSVATSNILYTTSGYDKANDNKSINWMIRESLGEMGYDTIENAVTMDKSGEDAYVTYYGGDFGGKVFSVVVLYANPLVEQLAGGDWYDWKAFYNKMPVKLYAGPSKDNMSELLPTHFKTAAWDPSVYLEYMVEELPADTKYVKAVMPATNNPNYASMKIGRIEVTGDKSRLPSAYVNPYLPFDASDALTLKFQQLYSEGREISAPEEGSVYAKAVVANERSRETKASLFAILYKNNIIMDFKTDSKTINSYQTVVFSTENNPFDINLEGGSKIDEYKIKLWVLTDIGAVTPKELYHSQLADNIGDIDASGYPKNKISVITPKYTNEISGDTKIVIAAPGFKQVLARCWKQGGEYGLDSVVATVDIDENGIGSFIFPANEYPHGPIIIRLSHPQAPEYENTDVKLETLKGVIFDMCNLQLYNLGGVSWNEGLKNAPVPEPAKALNLLYEDDFEGPMSISRWDSSATYSSHKPTFGDFSGIHFMDFEDENRNPFGQIDTYMRIRADQNKNSSGIISTAHQDHTGIMASPPAYFECKMVANYAKGSWPAVWFITNNPNNGPADEYDIIEAYGFDEYVKWAYTGFHSGFAEWGREKPTDSRVRNGKNIDMTKVGGGGSWFMGFHTYGMYLGEEETVFYVDNEEIWRFPTWPSAKENPMYLMFNLAVGGSSGWPRDLSRYDGMIDMYVDYIRIYN